jgi:hypothetical protein
LSFFIWLRPGDCRIPEPKHLTITALRSRRSPKGTVSTATVKPSPDVTSAVVAEYEAAGDALLAAAAAPDLKTSLRFPHPRFGPMDAAG